MNSICIKLLTDAVIVCQRESTGWYAWFSDWPCANYQHLRCYNGWQQCCRSHTWICSVLLHSCPSGISSRRMCDISGNTHDSFLIHNWFLMWKKDKRKMLMMVMIATAAVVKILWKIQTFVLLKWTDNISHVLAHFRTLQKNAVEMLKQAYIHTYINSICIPYFLDYKSLFLYMRLKCSD